MNPNTPVIIGVGQILQRAEDIESAQEPIGLMLEAAKLAADDAGVSGALASLDSVRVVRGIWRYKQPAGYIAAQLGAPQAETMGTPFGGNSVAVKQVPAALGHIPLQQLVEDVSDDIIEGGSGRPADDVVEHVLATMACHSSIRAGQTLSVYEMRALLTAIDKVDFSVCAHGRPVSIRIGSGELEKRFHRS